MKRSLLLHFALTLAVLAVANGLIWQKEALLRHGSSLFLALAPVDPRSLMQGDYMRLRYEVADKVPAAVSDEPAEGRLVVRPAEDGVAAFVRVGDGQPLQPGERWLRYHRSGSGQVRLGAESFFFEEGQADRYAKAKFGELKVTPAGESVLVGLCDEHRQRLGTTEPARTAPRQP